MHEDIDTWLDPCISTQAAAVAAVLPSKKHLDNDAVLDVRCIPLPRSAALLRNVQVAMMAVLPLDISTAPPIDVGRLASKKTQPENDAVLVALVWTLPPRNVKFPALNTLAVSTTMLKVEDGPASMVQPRPSKSTSAVAAMVPVTATGDDGEQDATAD